MNCSVHLLTITLKSNVFLSIEESLNIQNVSSISLIVAMNSTYIFISWMGDAH